MNTNFDWQKHQVDERIRDRLQEGAHSRLARSSRGNRATNRARSLKPLVMGAGFAALLAMIVYWVL